MDGDVLAVANDKNGMFCNKLLNDYNISKSIWLCVTYNLEVMCISSRA